MAVRRALPRRHALSPPLILSHRSIPPRRPPPPILHRRHFFGIGEILGVLANPSETLRSLTDSKRMLDEARAELQETRERAQIPTKHTFAPLPGFYDRPREIRAIERTLSSVPNFTVIFGGSSVGKTALLRQILTDEKYHVLHFDLRIAGFADLPSLFFSLATQMENFFTSLADRLPGYESFRKESLAFKHCRLDVERRLQNGTDWVKTSDIAHLLELFQSALLKYWEYEPEDPDPERTENLREKKRKRAEEDKEDRVRKEVEKKEEESNRKVEKGEATEAEARATLKESRTIKAEDESEKEAAERKKRAEAEADDAAEWKPPKKKIPVFFLDEAHKLPALTRGDDDAMKCILDALLVLTKQDRLCHVITATSDSFFMQWLRQFNVLQHCSILTVGDCDKEEAKKYFEEELRQEVPEELRGKLDFEELFEVFGGKLAHLQAFVADFVNSEGKLRVDQSSQFLQAYSLLHLQLVHTADPATARGFHIYSPLVGASPHASPSPSDVASQNAPSPPIAGPEFTPADLVHVMEKLTSSAPPNTEGGGGWEAGDRSESGTGRSQATNRAVSYFPLCRQLGARAVDGLVRGRILELRWTNTVSPEGDPKVMKLKGGKKRGHAEEMTGPVLLPTTPVMRHAMGAVLDELREEATAREKQQRDKPKDGEGKSEAGKGNKK